MSTRRELLDVVGARYRSAGRRQRSKILDEFVAVTGYHRKHAIRLLTETGVRAGGADRAASPDRDPRCGYGPGIREALIQLWEVSDRVCGTRLQPMIPGLLPSLERHGRARLARFLDPGLRANVLSRLCAFRAFFAPAIRVTDCRDAKDDMYLELALAADAE